MFLKKLSAIAARKSPHLELYQVPLDVGMTVTLTSKVPSLSPVLSWLGDLKCRLPGMIPCS